MQIDVKRFYLPGFTVRATCPKCGAEVEHDMGDRYLMYPRAEEFSYSMNHDAYDAQGKYDLHEWDVRVRLVVRLEAVSDCTVVEEE